MSIKKNASLTICFLLSQTIPLHFLLADNPQTTYCLKNDEAALQRLALLSQEDNPESQYFFQTLDIPNDATILSVGCGVGIFEQWLAQHVVPKGVVYAVDNDPIKVQYLQEIVEQHNIHNLIPLCDNAYTLHTCNTQRYDVVYARFLLEHLDDPNKAVACMVSLLKKGGYFIMDEETFSQNRTEPRHWAIESVSQDLTKKAEAHLHTNYDIGASLENIARNHNLEVKKQRSFEQRSGASGLELFISSIEESHDFWVNNNIMTLEEIDALVEGLQEVRRNAHQFIMVVKRNQLCAIK